MLVSSSIALCLIYAGSVSHLNLELTNSACLIGQLALGDPLSLFPPSLDWITWVQAWQFGVLEIQTGPHVSAASTPLVEPSSQSSIFSEIYFEFSVYNGLSFTLPGAGRAGKMHFY